MAPNFRDLLSMPTDSVERPKPLPEGHYIAYIKAHEFGTSAKKNTPYVRFLFSIESGSDDVSADDLANIDLTRRELRRDFYITPNALYRLSDMLDAVLGAQQGRSFDERIPDCRNAKVLIGVTQRQSEDGTDTFNDVTTVVAAP